MILHVVPLVANQHDQGKCLGTLAVLIFIKCTHIDRC